MNQSIGLIYLGMDWGPEYVKQSTKSNEAIGRVTRKEAFDFALKETRAALAALPDPADFDIVKVSDTVFAGICRQWGDIPDGEFGQACGCAPPAGEAAARPPRAYSPPPARTARPDPHMRTTHMAR